jgi:peptide/nickel transport system substrate-binding protein
VIARRLRARSIACLIVLGCIVPAAARAAQDGVFVYHLNAPPESLDPAKAFNSQRAQRVMWALYEPLVNLSQDSKHVEPALAESWEVGADGLTYTFHLRKNVRFHDGTLLNAEAVRVNLERNYLPGSRFYTADPPNVRERVLANLLREIVVRDEHTITLSLKTAKVHLLFLFPIVSPEALAKYGSKIGEHPVGTGPFRFVRWTSEEVRLTANPDYWGGRPKLTDISFRIIGPSERTMQEFLAGRLDFVPEVEPVYLERIVANPKTKIIRVPSLSVRYLGFYVDRKPFKDPRLRRAISKAIDVERAVLFTSRGLAIPAYGPIPPGGDAYDAGLKRNRHDPAGAKQLLAEAAVPPEFRITLLFNAGWSFFTELAQAIKTDLAKVGVTVDLAPSPGYRELVAEIRQGKGDMFIYDWFSLFTDPEIFLSPLFQTKAVDNLTRYSNADVDALLEQARNPLVAASARLELYRKAQRIIVSDEPMLFLFHEVRVSGYNARVANLELNVHSLPTDRFSRIQLKTD